MSQPESGVVVGCGSIGQRHIRNAATLEVAEIIGVDQDETARRQAKEAGATAIYPNLESALCEHSPTFGIVAVPNHIHVPVARQLATAGLDIFIEKPLSNTRDGVDRLIEEAHSKNLVSLVGCNFRFHPGIQKLREMLQDSAVGAPLTVRIEAGSYLPNWHPDDDYREMYSASEEMGGGAVLDFIHELNYARWLFGEVDTLTAMTASRSHLKIETEDVGAMILKMEDGPLCEIHVDYIQRCATRSCKIVGDEGILSWDFDRHTVKQYDPDVGKWITNDLPHWEFNDMYVEELDHFLSCVRSRTKSLCDIEEGRDDLLVALAALQSAETGQHISVT